MIVHSVMYYLTTVEGITWRGEDYTANKIVKTVKGEPFNGHFDLTIGGKKHQFTAQTAHTFLPALFDAIGRKMGEVVQGDFSVVPIPNSNAVAGSNADFRTWEHARMLTRSLGNRAEVVPALRWITEKQPAHKGGSRDPQVHFRNLRVVQRPARQIVLFDDVVTSGGQMVGSYRRLVQDASAPSVGFVVGRAVKEQKTPVLGWAAEDIPVQEALIDFDRFFGR